MKGISQQGGVAWIKYRSPPVTTLTGELPNMRDEFDRVGVGKPLTPVER
jgi:hypothetical protein